jgi:site-specific recombinase XerD
MAKFNFNLRNPGKSDYCIVKLIIRYNNLILAHYTEEHISPKHWNAQEQRAKQSKDFPQYPEFNRRLSYIKSKAETIFTRFLNDNNNRPPTTEELRVLLNQEFKRAPIQSKLDLFGFIEQFIEESKNMVNDKTGKPVALATIQSYRNHYRILKEFQKKSKMRLDFDTIDLDFYHDFIAFLQQEYKFATNTIGRHIKTLKVFLNDASERKIVVNQGYRSRRFKVIGENVDAIYLSEKELNEMYNLDLSGNHRLEKVRDLFLVGCWTGLRFSDFSQIQQRHFDGTFIKIETQKTRETVVIPIHWMVREIMNKYTGENTNSLPRSISNAKMNRYIKEVGEMLGSLHTKESFQKTRGGALIISTNKKYELITTHTARRSFSTNLFLSGFPAISIMKITGHRTEKAFLTYIKITPEDNAKLLQMHWQEKQELKAV